jgi:hypothetical protein
MQAMDVATMMQRMEGFEAPVDPGSRRKRLMAAVVALVLFLAGGLFVWFAFARGEPAGSAATTGHDGAAAPLPITAIVRCTTDGTELDTPAVGVQPDGLHIDAENLAQATGIDIAIDGGKTVLGNPAFRSIQREIVIVPVPPGQAEIACRRPEGGSVSGGPAEHPDLFVPIQILDPDGLYVSPELSCATSDQKALRGHIDVTTLFAAGGESFVRRKVSGIRSHDVVELTGYPDTTRLVEFGHTWRVVREGEVVAQINVPVLDGTACAGSGIGGA